MKLGLNLGGKSRENFLRWRRLLTDFFFGQSIAQFLQLVSGFAIIHWLTKDEYATFALLLAVKGTATVLMDLGFTSGLVALISDRCNQPSIVGRYIASARYFRNRLILFGGPVLLAALLLAANRYNWGIGLGTVFWMLLILSIFFEAQASLFKPVLTLQQRIREVYLAQITAGVVRLALLFAAFLLGVLNAPLALAMGIVQAGLVAFLYGKRIERDVQYPEPGDPLKTEKKEALDLTLPKVPGAVFYAVQGQVTIFIVGIFGQYDQIADMGALSRIAMLYMLPGALISHLVVPWFAKLSPDAVLKGYAGAFTVFSIFGICLIFANWFFPEAFLFILGDGYENLGYEVFLFSIAATLNLLAGLVYSLNSSRKWVYYWTGPASILAYLVALVVFVTQLNMALLSNVILLAIVTTGLTFAINLAVSAVGFLGPKRSGL